MRERILIIDDEEAIRFSLRGILEDEGYNVLDADNAENGLRSVSENMPDLVFLDIWMSGMDGMTALEQLGNQHPTLPVIMISGHGTIETAVSAIRLGAYDFIEKPLSLEKVILTTDRALEMSDLRRQNQILRCAQPGQNEMIGISPAMRQFKETLDRVAGSDAWVLITGENGVGKELAARTIHNGSARAREPMIAVNCAAIPEELIESELFGHEKGSFTGAHNVRVGRFEMAHKGTLFLDEIGDMSQKTQARILRVLQEQCFERVGGTRTINVDVRVIAATNKNLEQAIADQAFRADLYYRLRVMPLHVPPLRERCEDIELLTQVFIDALPPKDKKPRLSDEVITALRAYHWPGNVRELRNFVDRMGILFPGKIIHYADLPLEMRSANQTATTPQTCTEHDAPAKYMTLGMDFKSARAAFEAHYLNVRLRECGGNITRLAEAIGIERTYLHRKLKSLKIGNA
jgi:two-component system nitrogen regulation response regulator NtrX